jgi:hypothetical protein
MLKSTSSNSETLSTTSTFKTPSSITASISNDIDLFTKFKDNDSYAIIIQQTKSNKSKKSTSLKFFIILYYIKHYLPKLKIIFVTLSAILLFTASLFLLVVGAMNINSCKIINRIPLYLIIFGVAVITRLALYISCPFNYVNYRNFFKTATKSQNYMVVVDPIVPYCCCCCYGKKSEPQLATKKMTSNMKSSVSSTSALNFISNKFSESVPQPFKKQAKRLRGYRHKSATIVMRNHHHRPTQHNRVQYTNTKYKFIDFGSIRYGTATFMQRVIDLFILCWFVYGNYVVFGINENAQTILMTTVKTGNATEFQFKMIIKPRDWNGGGIEFCGQLSYKTAFVQIIITYALIAFLLIFYVLYSTCKLVYRFSKKIQKENSYIDNSF